MKTLEETLAEKPGNCDSSFKAVVEYLDNEVQARDEVIRNLETAQQVGSRAHSIICEDSDRMRKTIQELETRILELTRSLDTMKKNGDELVRCLLKSNDFAFPNFDTLTEESKEAVQAWETSK